MNALKTKKKTTKRKLKATDNKRLKTLLLKGPVMSDSQFQAFLKTRELFEQWKGK
jgi:hypothetical protein